MPTVHQLRLEGNEHFEAGRLDDAIACFLNAIDLFTEERSTAPEVVDDFVKAAGNLCVCYYGKKEYDACFKAAREALGVYPVIPKAYGSMGMCMMDRLAEQQANAASYLENSDAALDASNGDAVAVLANRASRNADERLRRDPQRYVVKLAGVLCSVDEAHEHLCRAVLLSEGSLQVSLGPYIESAVKHINEQFISACHALERQHGDAVLDDLCPAEDSLAGAPLCLSTAPPAVRDTVMAIDPANRESGGRPVPVPRQEAATILADAAARQALQQQQQQQGQSTAVTESLADRPADFALSGKPMAVRVCHAERGGLPRGLTLLRAERPFAVAAWLMPPSRLAAPSSLGTAANATEGRVELLQDEASGTTAVTHADPVNMLAPVPPSAETVARHFETAFGGGSDGSVQVGPADPLAPKSMYCSHCGKEVAMSALMSGAASSCTVCGGVVYCSSECCAAYEERHRRYECKLRAKLQEIVVAAATRTQCGGGGKEEKQASVEDATAADVSHDDGAPPSTCYQEETPGSFWTAHHFLHCVLPLAIAVYSGLCAETVGHEKVRAQLEKGVPRWRVAAIPPAAAEAIHSIASLMELIPLSEETREKDNAERVLQQIALMVRLHQCPPPVHSADEGDRSEHPFSFFYWERLLFRHSCEANCRWVSAMRTVVTSRFICKGEELTVAVETNEGSDSAAPAELFPQHWPWQIRRKWLLRHHGFDCRCARCEREGNHLNTARGDLSNDMTEQLLSGDRLQRPKVVSSEPVTHPTHYFHPRVHKTIREARAVASGGKEGDIKHALRLLQDAARAAEAFLLPSHYLFEDIRTATAGIAAMCALGKEEIALSRSVGGQSLLFYESMWAGAVPAKIAVMERLPAPPEGLSRRRNHLRQMRSARAAHLQGTTASGEENTSVDDTTASAALLLEDSPEKKQEQAQQRAAGGAGARAPNRRRRLPPRPERDFTEGTVAEHFYGSYQSWYS